MLLKIYKQQKYDFKSESKENLFKILVSLVLKPKTKYFFCKVIKKMINYYMFNIMLVI